MNFEEMQGVWAGQSSEASGTPRGGEAGRFLNALAAAERRQSRVTTIKAAAVVLMLIPALAWLLIGPERPPAFVLGVLWCVASIAGVIAVVWRARFRLSALDYAAASSAFLQQASQLVRSQDAVRRRASLALAFALAVGLNIILIGLPMAQGARRSPLHHVLVTLVPLVTLLAVRRLGLERRQEDPVRECVDDAARWLHEDEADVAREEK